MDCLEKDSLNYIQTYKVKLYNQYISNMEHSKTLIQEINLLKEKIEKIIIPKSPANTYQDNEATPSDLYALVVAQEMERQLTILIAQHRESFHTRFLQNQLGKYLLADGRQVRWDLEMIHFCHTLQYYGGEKMYQLLRGKNPQGKRGKINITDKLAIVNLYLLGSSTLKSYLPPTNTYPSLLESIKYLSEVFNGGSITDCVGFLVLDEMQIRPGIVYRKTVGKLIGWTTLVPEKGISSKSLINLMLVKRILQFFYISLSAKSCLPLTYIPTAQNSDLKYHIDQALGLLHDNKVTILAIATNGFSGSISLSKQMMEKGYQYFLDYIHLIKKIRNECTNHCMYSPLLVDGWCFSDFVGIWEYIPELKGVLTSKHFVIVDSMESKTIMNIFTLLSIIQQGISEQKDIPKVDKIR